MWCCQLISNCDMGTIHILNQFIFAALDIFADWYSPNEIISVKWRTNTIPLFLCFAYIVGGSAWYKATTLQGRHNRRDSVSIAQLHDCLLNRLFRRRSKIISKLRFPGLCADNSPVTGDFPAQMASNAENVSIWWRHHDPAHPSIKRSIARGKDMFYICSTWVYDER